MLSENRYFGYHVFSVYLIKKKVAPQGSYNSIVMLLYLEAFHPLSNLHDM